MGHNWETERLCSAVISRRSSCSNIIFFSHQSPWHLSPLTLGVSRVQWHFENSVAMGSHDILLVLTPYMQMVDPDITGRQTLASH